MLHVENMTPADFSFAVGLANTMGWDMAQQDFGLSLKLEPEGCFVLFDNLSQVGISTCISFGKVGWFGNLVVDQTHRNQGGGMLLLQEAIDHMRKNGVETIGLYSYRDLTRFYENFGFQSNTEFLVIKGKTETPQIHEKLERITNRDVSAVIKFDEEFFHGNRKRLLAPILLNKKNHCYISKRNGGIDGYIASKRNDTMTEVGPLICRSGQNELAESLLKAVLTNSKDEGIFVCVPTANKTLLEALADFEIQESFRITRMFLGTKVAESCIYIPESLERG
jgi:GNAT superfamily N-acetyltransferase